MRIVIAGAGVSGLAASILLARSGHDTTLVERHTRTAPVLRGFSRQGLHFDTGFHISGGLEDGGTLRQWLRVLGVEDKLQPLPMREDSASLFVFPDGTRSCLPYGLEAIVHMTAREFPGYEAKITDFLHQMHQIVRTSPYMDTKTALQVAQSAKSGQALAGAEQTGSYRLTDYLADLPPKLATMLASYTLLYGVEPGNSSWKNFCVVAEPFVQATHTLEGGGLRLAEVLEDAARAAGVRILCGHALTALELDATNAVRGVTLDQDTSLECEICLFTGHPRQLGELVPPKSLRDAYLRHLAKLPESPAPFLVFAHTRSDAMDGRSLYLPGGLHPEDLYAPGKVEEQTIYLSCGPAHPDGRRPLVAVTSCPDELEDSHSAEPCRASRAARAAMAARLLARIRRQYPELEDIELVDTATPSTMRRWVYGGTGSLYGARHGLQDGELAPLTRIRGLLLAGQNVLLPGILGGIISAAVAVNLIHGPQDLFEEFARCAKNA